MRASSSRSMAPSHSPAIHAESPTNVDRALTLAALSALGLQAALDPRAHPRAALAVAAVAITLALWAIRAARKGAAVTMLAACITSIAAFALIWQLTMLLALGLYYGLTRIAPALRPPPGMGARGRIPW